MKLIIVHSRAAALVCSLALVCMQASGQNAASTNNPSGTNTPQPPAGASNTTATIGTTNPPPTPTAPPTAPAGGTAQASNNPLNVSVVTDPNQMVLKYEEFLRHETKEQRELFESYYKRLAGLVTVVLAVLAFLGTIFGIKTYRDLRRSLKAIVLERVEEKVRNEIVAALAERKQWMENQHRSDRLKVYREFKAAFGSLFEASRELRDRRVSGIPNAAALKGKKILWVDDDPVGIACQIAILESLGTRVDLAQTTDAALKQITSDAYNLVISNMNRFPDPTAGVDLTRKIRATSQVPILIFTVAERLASHGKLATDAGATALESATDKLLVAVYNLIIQPIIITAL